MSKIIANETIIDMYTEYEKQGMYDSMDILEKVLVDLELTDVEKQAIHIIAVSDTVRDYVKSTHA